MKRLLYVYKIIRKIVYNESSIDSIETLKAKIQAALREISDETRHSAITYFRNRLRRCVEIEGKQVEI